MALITTPVLLSVGNRGCVLKIFNKMDKGHEYISNKTSKSCIVLYCVPG